MMQMFNFVIVFSGIYITLVVKGVTQGEIHHVRNYRRDDVCGDGLCTCIYENANCVGHGKKLWYIPKLPNITQNLNIEGNFFPKLDGVSFANVSDLKLEELSLSKNSVTKLSRDTFQNLPFLKELNLREETRLNSSELSNAFSSLSKNVINIISLTEMKWSVIDEQLFSFLNDSSLEIIHLSQNKLKTLNFKIFSGLKILSKINLEQNYLTELEIFPLRNLQSLNLNDNAISEIPNFCADKLQTTYFPSLKDLFLSSNKIKILNQKTFDCLPQLESLILKLNPFTNISDNFISTLPALNYLDLSQKTSSHANIGEKAFNSSTLETLILNNLVYQFFMEKRSYLYAIFKNCPNLIKLKLTETTLPDDKVVLNALFAHITRIHVLDLTSTEIAVLPEESISQMTSLEHLSLSGNLIRSWNGTTMFRNSRIVLLDMRSNQISVLNSTSFPSNMLKYLYQLDLSQNPFLCTCQTLESINVIRDMANILLTVSDDYELDEYQCFSPSEVSGTLVIDYNPSADSCTEKNIALLVSVPVSIIAVTTISVMLLLYKWRWRLRYGIYLLKNRNKNYDRLEGSNGFEYASFVIYSDADRHWVHNELIHRLEDKEGLRLCIRLRDFAVGKVHVDNIVDNMSLSEKIIVILSNNFARDEWCDFQLLLAETRLLKQNTDMLVIFMLEEINSDCLRASLYKLVTERQFALWSDDETGKELFWKQAVLHMKKSTAKEYGTFV